MRIKKYGKTMVGFLLAAAFISTAGNLLVSGSLLKKEPASEQMAAYVGENGLYLTLLSKGETKQILESKKVRAPKFSDGGNYLAFDCEGMLNVCSLRDGEIRQVAKLKNTEFDWKSDARLIFAGDEGLYEYYPAANVAAPILEDGKVYSDVMCDHLGFVYASRYSREIKEDGEYLYPEGIIQYSFADGSVKMILEGESSNADDMQMGYRPCVAGVSNDGRYVYIWHKPSSGSLTADGVRFGIYDVSAEQLIPPSVETNIGAEEDVYNRSLSEAFALAYRDNFSPNPNNGLQLALNSGSGREMYYNKTIGILDAANDTFCPLTTDGEAAMTPIWLNDGKRIVYSMTAEMDLYNILEQGGDTQMNLWGQWFGQPHHLYQADVASGERIPLTDGEYFDFAPRELANGDIIFVRRELGGFEREEQEYADTKEYALYLLKEGNITKISEPLALKDGYAANGFYGHMDTAMVFDIYGGVSAY